MKRRGKAPRVQLICVLCTRPLRSPSEHVEATRDVHRPLAMRDAYGGAYVRHGGAARI